MDSLRRALTLFLASAAIVFTGCQKDDPPEPTRGPRSTLGDGSVSALMNGTDLFNDLDDGVTAWFGQEMTCLEGTLSVGVVHFSERGIGRISYGISNIVHTLDTQRVWPYAFRDRAMCDSDSVTATFGTFISDGDVVGDIYNLLPTANNFVKLTALDTAARIIEGDYEMTFVIEPLSEGSSKKITNIPDTIRLTDGRFVAEFWPDEE